MRVKILLMMLMIVNATVLYCQDVKSEAGCGSQHPMTYWYYNAVMQEIRLPGKSLISISISVTGLDSKIALRAKSANEFELVEGIPEQNIYELLSTLDRSCKLPPDPGDAAKLVKLSWKVTPLSELKFAELHRNFANAVKQSAGNIDARYSSLLKEGDVITLHARRFSVTYDTYGFEHIQLEANESSNGSGESDPIVTWAQSILQIIGKQPSQKRP